MGNKKLLLVFPDGVGIRNYLYSDFFNDTSSERILFHNFSPGTAEYLKLRNNIDGEITIPRYSESAREKFLRELICLSRLKFYAKKNNNPTSLTNWNWEHSTISKKLFYKAIAFASAFVSNYKTILSLEKRYQSAIRNNPFYKEVKKVISEIQPEHVFCSHQRGLKMPVIFAAAHDLGVPTSTVIYSWDNLPKARMALKSDQYLVWSEYMKDEMAFYYPEISEKQVVVSGTPQFEFYRNPSLIIDRTKFFEKYGLDPAKKIVCFSGDDAKTSPDDPKYLDDVAHEIVKSGMADKLQILFRRSPGDLSGRYDTIIAKYGELIKPAEPMWSNSTALTWNEVFPLYEDVSLLVSTVFYSDLVINLGSTMAFDFAMNDKPCLFINYDQEIKNRSDWSVGTIYRFQHFRSMDGLEPVGWINSCNEISMLIQKALEFPKTIGSDRKKWMDKVVGNPDNSRFKLV